MYCPKQVVGDVFEQKVAQIFNLIRIDGKLSGNVPDLISRDLSFYVEVKASAYDNGGVIKGAQLMKFDRGISKKRLYAFAYHVLSIRNKMSEEYPTEEELRNALNLKSLYLFPFSIVWSFYNHSKERGGQNGLFVQMRESDAEKIFSGQGSVWGIMQLRKRNYRTSQPFPKVHIITREGQLEEQIVDSIRPEFLD